MYKDENLEKAYCGAVDDVSRALLNLQDLYDGLLEFLENGQDDEEENEADRNAIELARQNLYTAKKLLEKARYILSACM